LLDPVRLVLRPIELSTEVISSVEGVRSLLPDYRRLERVTGNTLPFTLYEWHLAWCEHLLNRHPQRREQLQLFVLRNRSGECVALVPLVLSRWRVGPLKLATVDFLGADQGVTEIRRALIEPGYERLVVRAVHERLASHPTWKWVQWRGVDGALAEALTREVGPQWYQVGVDCLLDLPPSWDDFRAGLPRNLRESLRHCYNSLRRDGHDFELVVARGRDQVLWALPRFLELHAMRARMPWGPAHPDYFANPALQEFLRDVCARLAARDVVRLFQLRIAGTVVASQLGFVLGDSLYLYYSGFDPAWARYAVMTTTLAETLRYAIAHGLRTANLSPTAVRAKLRWRPRLVEVRSGLVRHAALGSRLACGAYCLAHASEKSPLRLLKRLLRSQVNWQ
jgi:CelD/BcsL family acetyltransferase involved in cellulose biosynthesis